MSHSQRQNIRWAFNKSFLCLQVAVIARQILDKDLSDRKKTAELDIAPMLAGSYHNLVLSELNRRIKHVSSAFYRTPPTKLFGAYGGPEFAAWSFWQLPCTLFGSF